MRSFCCLRSLALDWEGEGGEGESFRFFVGGEREVGLVAIAGDGDGDGVELVVGGGLWWERRSSGGSVEIT